MNKNKHQINWIQEEYAFIQRRVKENLEQHGPLFPGAASDNLIYEFGGNVAWTPSFWTGMIALSYELTGEQLFKTAFDQNLVSFEERLVKQIEIDNHDIGFYYSLSHVANYQLFQSAKSRQIIIDAAEALISRFNPITGIIQAWGNPDEPSEQGRMIIDCNMNLCLLYRAYELTGDQRFYDSAYSHIKKAQEYLVREDSSTFHTYFFNPETGEPLKGTTAQGYSDRSAWARGQAWAVYGFTLNYGFTGDESLLETAIETADYFIERLPTDLVPYWDLEFTEGDQYRDSSAGSILACGLLELSRQLPITHPKRTEYEQLAQMIVESLKENYTTKNDCSNGIIKHAIYSVPHNLGVDECCLWGDYFYYEALVRLERPWRPYW